MGPSRGEGVPQPGRHRGQVARQVELAAAADGSGRSHPSDTAARSGDGRRPPGQSCPPATTPSPCGRTSGASAPPVGGAGAGPVSASGVSPITDASVSILVPARAGSDSTWTTRSLPACSGWWSSFASYSPVSRCTSPEPDVATHRPSRPVVLVCAHARNPDASSWWTSTNRSWCWGRRIASNRPLTPSSGSAMVVSTPHSIHQVTSVSAALGFVTVTSHRQVCSPLTLLWHPRPRRRRKAAPLEGDPAQRLR